MKMGVGHKLITTKWGAPAAMLMCAGGFSFHGDKAWMNQRVFCVDTDAVCQMIAKLYPSEQFHATRPGQTFVMEGHRLQARSRRTRRSSRRRRAPTWPSRAKATAATAPDYAPATGRRDARGRRRARQLERRARASSPASLVGGTIFKGLALAARATQRRGRAPTFALVLRHGERRREARLRVRADGVRVRRRRTIGRARRVPRGHRVLGDRLCSRCCAASSGRSR